MRDQQPIKKDEWAIVLDFLANGLAGMSRSQPIAQVVGDKYFSLLEVIIRDEITLKPGDRVYIGDGKRDQVRYIVGRVGVDKLTSAAKEELDDCVESIVLKNPQQFLEFFNTSGPLTTRLHQLELLPGIGKKHLWAVIEERKSKPFESFEDIKKRVPLLPDPKKMMVKRIIEELQETDKYSLFVLRIKEKERYVGSRDNEYGR